MDGRPARRGFLSQALIWDDHAWVIPRIRAALDAGVPPTAVILRDPGRKEYGVWDLKLVAALRLYDDLMRGSIPVYWDESDRVRFEVKTGLSKSNRAIQMRQERDEKNKGVETKGMYYYAVPQTIDGGPLPTREEWLEERMAKQGKRPEGPQRRSPQVGLEGTPPASS